MIQSRSRFVKKLDSASSPWREREREREKELIEWNNRSSRCDT